jgi:hypothetical protein
MLKQGLGDEAKKVPFISVPDFVARMVALFDPIVRGRLYELGKRRLVSSEKPDKCSIGLHGRSQRPYSTPRGAFRQAICLEWRGSLGTTQTAKVASGKHALQVPHVHDRSRSHLRRQRSRFCNSGFTSTSAVFSVDTALIV